MSSTTSRNPTDFVANIHLRHLQLEHDVRTVSVCTVIFYLSGLKAMLLFMVSPVVSLIVQIVASTSYSDLLLGMWPKDSDHGN